MHNAQPSAAGSAAGAVRSQFRQKELPLQMSRKVETAVTM